MRRESVTEAGWENRKREMQKEMKNAAFHAAKKEWRPLRKTLVDHSTREKGKEEEKKKTEVIKPRKIE